MTAQLIYIFLGEFLYLEDNYRCRSLLAMNKANMEPKPYQTICLKKKS